MSDIRFTVSIENMDENAPDPQYMHLDFGGNGVSIDKNMAWTEEMCAEVFANVIKSLGVLIADSDDMDEGRFMAIAMRKFQQGMV